MAARLGLLGRFSLLSLIAFAVLGAALSHLISSQIRERALANAVQSASLIARFGIQPQLSASDMRRGLTPEAIDALDESLRAGYTSESVDTIKLWGPDARVIYSNDRALIGKHAKTDSHLRDALAGGSVAEVTNADEEIVAPSAATGKLIEVYVPLHFGSDPRPAGAFEIYLHYGPVAASVARDTHRLYLWLFGGLLVLYAALFRIAADASRRLRRQAADNERQARTDGLTGLPNRAAFNESVEKAIEQATPGFQTAVVVLDLDRFKEVNETLGYQSGDALLRQAAARLTTAVRASDTVARVGSDEFALLLPNATVTGATEVAQRARAMLEASFTVEGLAVDIEVSAGMAHHPEHASTADVLFRHAELAMHRSKDSRAGLSMYEPTADEARPERLSMLGELRRAIDAGELVLHYQPKAALATGEVAAVEALVRWIHPGRGMVPPNEFIPLAEHTGLIKQLSAYVLNAALQQQSRWRAAGLDLAVAVNLSARNLADERLPDEVAALLERWGTPANRLCVEITESTIMSEPERAMQVLLRLSEMGVSLSIDDYGTGYSSLAYLKRLPVHELKIDRTFVSDLESNDEFIVRSTIDLARNLGLRVVAEGVETEDGWRKLTELGCDLAQGYYLSRPLPPAELERWLAREGAPAA